MDQVDNSFIRITSIEDSEEYNRANIHQHSYYELIWLTQADVKDTIQIDFGEYPVSNDCFFFISAGQLHRIDRTGKKGLVIALSKDFFHSIVPMDIYPRSTFAINSIINQRKCDLCRSLVQLIITEYKGNCRYSLMDAYFKALFIHLGPIFDKNPCCGSKKKGADLLDLIEKHYMEHKEVAFYANEISLSEKASNDLAKRVLGKNLKDLLQDRLVLEIKREIAADNLSFKEIADKLGFNEPSYFTRFFKKQTNFTPKEYKEYFNTLIEE